MWVLRGAWPWLVVRPRPTQSTFRQTRPPRHPPPCPGPDRPAKQAQKKPGSCEILSNIIIIL